MHNKRINTYKLFTENNLKFSKNFLEKDKELVDICTKLAEEDLYFRELQDGGYVSDSGYCHEPAYLTKFIGCFNEHFDIDEYDNSDIINAIPLLTEDEKKTIFEIWSKYQIEIKKLPKISEIENLTLVLKDEYDIKIKIIKGYDESGFVYMIQFSEFDFIDMSHDVDGGSATIMDSSKYFSFNEDLKHILENIKSDTLLKTIKIEYNVAYAIIEVTIFY